MAIADLRTDYHLSKLERTDLADDPLVEFGRWFGQALGHGGRLRRLAIALYKALRGGGTGEANAMALATVDGQGRPANRMVLLKGVDARGFTFFTNYHSRKGRHLAANPQAALVFYWSDLERQVCISGTVTPLRAEESQAYFRTRPRGSRIAAWASDQSTPIADRTVLDQRVAELEARFARQEVPIPPHWGGYLLQPDRFEFWQGRRNRLHDRFCYTRTAEGWQIERLAP